MDRLDVRERYAGYHAALRASGHLPDENLEITGKWAWVKEIEGGCVCCRTWAPR